MRPKTLDHVAFWVAERDRIADFVTAHMGMHVIDRTDTFTLVGADARRSKLTLFDARGPRERGALRHVAFRVNDLDRALEELPADRPRQQEHGGVYFDLYEGLRLGLVQAETESDYDFDHVALFSSRPEETARAYESVRLPARRPRRAACRAWSSPAPGSSSGRGLPTPATGRCSITSPCSSTLPTSTSSPPVSSASRCRTSWTRRTPTRRSFGGRTRVRIEYVEHKPTFSLK